MEAAVVAFSTLGGVSFSHEQREKQRTTKNNTEGVQLKKQKRFSPGWLYKEFSYSVNSGTVSLCYTVLHSISDAVIHQLVVFAKSIFYLYIFFS